VGNDDDVHRANQPGCLPTLLTKHMAVLVKHHVGILENSERRLKADAVLGLVRPIFRLVPFEI